MSRLHPRLLARLRTSGALAVAGTLASLSLAAGPLAYAEEREPPRASPSRTPSATSSLAGNQAGQGRPRPGRTSASPEVSESGAVDESVGAVPSPSPSPSTTGRTPSGSASASPSASASRSAEPKKEKKREKKREPTTEPEPEPDRRDESGGDEDVDLWDDSEAADDAPFAPRTPPQDASAQEQSSQAVSQPVARAVPALTLGIGMALMGLGIGFFGVRLRRH